jgi:hypothetical protein
MGSLSRVGLRTRRTLRFLSSSRSLKVRNVVVILLEIVDKRVPDVREALKQFRDQMIEQIKNGVTNPQFKLS